MEFLWLQPPLAACQGMVCVTDCTVIQACEEHILEADEPDEDHVLVTLIRLRVSPEDLMLRLGIEEGIAYVEVMVRVELQKPQAILIYLANSTVTGAGRL